MDWSLVIGFVFGIVDWHLVIGFVFGIIASGIAAIMYERATRPKLEVTLDDEPRAQGQIQGRPPHEFYHVKVRNRAAVWPLPGRKPAWSCKALIEVLDTHGSRVISQPIHARWTSQPEPLLPGVAGGQAVNLVDFARVMNARKIDIHSHEDQQLSLVLKFEGQAECYLFSNESYLFNWTNAAWRLNPGTYRVRVVVFYERGTVERDFELDNLGTTRDSLKLRCAS